MIIMQSVSAEPSCNSPALVKKGVFTTTSTRQTARMRQGASEMTSPAQLEDVQRHRAMVHESFILKHESERNLSESDRQQSVLMLLREAARYHAVVSRNSASSTALPNPPVEAWWKCLVEQVSQFFVTVSSSDCTISPALRAIENLSSMGIWFTEDQMAMHKRLYTVLAFSHINHEEAAVYYPVSAVGLCNFSYCNYVNDSRKQRQLSVLAAFDETKNAA